MKASFVTQMNSRSAVAFCFFATSRLRPPSARVSKFHYLKIEQQQVGTGPRKAVEPHFRSAPGHLSDSLSQLKERKGREWKVVTELLLEQGCR